MYDVPEPGNFTCAVWICRCALQSGSIHDMCMKDASRTTLLCLCVWWTVRQIMIQHDAGATNDVWCSMHDVPEADNRVGFGRSLVSFLLVRQKSDTPASYIAILRNEVVELENWAVQQYIFHQNEVTGFTNPGYHPNWDVMKASRKYRTPRGMYTGRGSSMNGGWRSGFNPQKLSLAAL